MEVRWARKNGCPWRAETGRGGGTLKVGFDTDNFGNLVQDSDDESYSEEDKEFCNRRSQKRTLSRLLAAAAPPLGAEAPPPPPLRRRS